MQSPPFWPLASMTSRQCKVYDEAFSAAIDKAGSISRLSTDLSQYADNYVSHQSIRTWRKNYRVPPQWALVIEEYTNGDANFFNLVPWLLPRTVKYSQEES